MRDRVSLMLITDPEMPSDELVPAVRSALRGGVTAVQIRRPGATAAELTELIRVILPPAREHGASVIVNDRVDVALCTGADGVHLKRTSLPPADVRKLIGPDRLLGVSTHEEREVDEAAAAGADYVVFGPVFETPSKAGILAARGPERFRRVSAVAGIPVLALGGIDRHTLPLLLGVPLHGVAVIRAIFAEKDPEAAARELLRMLLEGH